MYTKFHGEIVDNADPTDAILRGYFPDYNYKGTIIEIGGYDPILLSNSYHFERNGWTTYPIEANHLDFSKFSSRKSALNYACSYFDKDDVEFDVVTSSGNGWTAGFSSLELDKELVDKYGAENIKELKKIKVKVRKLDTLIETEMKGLSKIDILTVDVEGSELDVLKGFNLSRWSPDIIFIENHFFRDGECDIHKYLSKAGYHIDKNVQYNYFYKKG